MKIDLQLYEGKGKTRGERNRPLTPFEAPYDFDNAAHYVADEGLRHAVNVALALGRPLLVTGDPGTGKTQLAGSIAYELELPKPLVFNTKTTSTAADLFYEYDAIRRFHDAQSPGADIDPKQYVTYTALGLAVLLTKSPPEVDKLLPGAYKGKGPTRSVVLIDEIDKAPRDLPNDILDNIEKMNFTVTETGESFEADPTFRPIVVLSSNSEKNLPEAFLRRCFFYHIEFPKEPQLREIIHRKFSANGEPDAETKDIIDAAVQRFYEIRGMRLKKKPATAELLDWLTVLIDLKHTPKEIRENSEAVRLTYTILAKAKEDLKRLQKAT